MDPMPSARLLATLLVLAAAPGLAGCGASTGTQPQPWIGGLPPDAPPRAAIQPPFPDVYDVPARRPTKLMSEQEQARTQAELGALRHKVNTQADALERERTGGNR